MNYKNSLHFLLITFWMSSLVHDMAAQCSADYSTTNNLCDLDSLYLHAQPLAGNAPFTFLWETGETTQTISIPLAFGDYLVTITDADGCTVVINCHIKPYPQVLYYPFNQNACEGDTVLLFLDWFRDSIPGALYEWSTGETTSTILLTDDLVWSVTVTDPATGCEFIIPPGLFDFHPTPYPEIVGPTTICPGQTITLTVNGGPFGTIVWYPGGVYDETLQVSAPGQYVVWGSSVEANYCWHQDTVDIVLGEIAPPVLEAPPTLCSGQGGTITITNSSLYTSFVWAGGQTTPTISVTQPGIYMVTVTNAGGCTATGEISVGTGQGPALELASTGSTCGENNGSIDLTPSPAGTYTYQWSNGSTTQDLSNLLPGTYSVTVTTFDGCVSTGADIIPDNPLPITINGVVNPQTSCVSNNGAITTSISPTASYAFQWSNGSTTPHLSNLAAGVYSVTVTTGNTCSAIAEFMVPDATNAPTVSAELAHAVCGDNTGSIHLIVTGGTPPFLYLWSNGEVTEDVANLVAGIYVVTVTGADGCTSVLDFEIEDQSVPILITGALWNTTSCTEPNGGIDITLQPPGNYTYQWTTGAITEDLSDLPAGTYEVTVSLGNSCMATAEYIIQDESSALTIIGEVQQNTSCQMPNGSIDIQVTPAGDHTFEWSHGATSEDVVNLMAGTYSVTVSSSDGCTGTASFAVVDINTGFSLTGISTPNSSCTAPNGSIDILMVPSGVYTYLWSTGSMAEDLNDLPPGGYEVTVTDPMQCALVATFVVSDETLVPTITGTVLPASCLQANGGIDLLVSSGPGLTYQWSNGVIQEDNPLIPSGEYSVTVVTDQGCQATDTFFVPEIINPISISGDIDASTSCLAADGRIDMTVLPAGSYDILWSSGSTSEDLVSLSPGTYTVTVTDTLGCRQAGTFIVPDSTAIPAISGIVTSADCTSPNGSIDVTVLTAFPPAQYLWSNGSMLEDLTLLVPGMYVVTVTDGSGCSAVDTFNITSVNSNFTISAVITPDTSCVAAAGGIDISILPSGMYAFAWSNGIMTEDIISLDEGTFSLTVTDGLGCSSTATYVIPGVVPDISLTSTIQPDICGHSNGSVQVDVVSPFPVVFNWSNGGSTEVISTLAAGLYTLTVTDQHDCSMIDTFLVPSEIININTVIDISHHTDCLEDNGSIRMSILPDGAYQIQWSNGAVTEDISDLHSGIYTVTVTSGPLCRLTDTAEILDQRVLPEISGMVVPARCGNANGMIDLRIINGDIENYLWSNGVMDQDLDHLVPGIYSVTVTDWNACSTDTTFNVMDESGPDFTLSLSVASNLGDSLQILAVTDLPVAAIDSLVWTPGHLFSCTHTLCLQQMIAVPSSPLTIEARLVDTLGCMAFANLELNAVTQPEVYIPNVFTPNQDGLNDRFTIYGNDDVEEVEELRIFDRWGNFVFMKREFPPNEDQYGWDGRFGDTEMNPAVFAYWAQVRYTNGKVDFFKGDVTLIR